ncbi:MAG: family 65 glycosyl hydrolase [Actinomycetota bacterium]|nr:family 65 glycosyl hydrolase [Actinomycetota bacterium]
MIDHPAFEVDPWTVRETALNLDMLAQSESVFALANGHLGLRGNLDEGEPRALSGTYLNGFYESFPAAYVERGYGYPEDGQQVVNVTDGKLIRLLVEDQPFDVHRGRLEHHERVLDLRTGILQRTAEWRSESGLGVRVNSRRLVSFVQRGVAAICYEVDALEQPMRVAVQSELLANQGDVTGGADPRAGAALTDVLLSRLAVHNDLRVVLGHTTRGSGISMAAGMDNIIESDVAATTLVEVEPDLGRVTISAGLVPGRPLRLVKMLAYHWSSQQSLEWLRDQVDASLQNALARGFDGLAASQREYLDRWWEVAGVDVDGDPEVQQALHFALFQVLQASARTDSRAIPAKGLTGKGYDGHVFWDTEAFVLPVLTYTRPDLVRSALTWRHSTLPLARERAAQLGLRGAALPWRTIHGEECSTYWPAGTAAFHVSADVAEAVRRYVDATGDDDFETTIGCELLVETARLWASLGTHDALGRFNIEGVTGPDEYSAVVDNNVFTNLMAQRNLRAAAVSVTRHPEVGEQLGVGIDEVGGWRDAADHMHIPYDDLVRVHPQDEDFTRHERWDFEDTPPDAYPLLLHRHYLDLYRKQVVKQADLVMALYACGDFFTDEEKRRNFEYYEALTVRDSSLSACVQSIVAAEVGHLDLAYDYLGEAALMDIADLEHNVLDGVHIASLAGAVLAVMAGMGGMRDHGGELSFRPRLPRGLDRVSFPVVFRGRRLRVEVGPQEARYSLAEGDEELRITHGGETVDLAGGTAATRAIPPAPELPPPVQPRGRAPARRSVADASTTKGGSSRR